jgi:hypothetical protein
MRRMQERPFRLVVVCQCIALFGVLALVPRIGVAYDAIAIQSRRGLLGHVPLLWDRQNPRAGELVIPPRALEVIQMAREYKLKSLRLSNGLSKNEEVQQRVAEGVWPIRVRKKSRNLFISKGEEVPQECELQHSGWSVEYVRCG